MLDIVDRGGHAAFKRRYDAAVHLLRRNAGVGPEDGNHRDVDVGENILLHRYDGKAAENGNQNRHHDEGVRAA